MGYKSMTLGEIKKANPVQTEKNPDVFADKKTGAVRNTFILQKSADGKMVPVGFAQLGPAAGDATVYEYYEEGPGGYDTSKSEIKDPKAVTAAYKPPGVQVGTKAPATVIESTETKPVATTDPRRAVTNIDDPRRAVTNIDDPTKATVVGTDTPVSVVEEVTAVKPEGMTVKPATTSTSTSSVEGWMDLRDLANVAESLPPNTRVYVKPAFSVNSIDSITGLSPRDKAEFKQWISDVLKLAPEGRQAKLNMLEDEINWDGLLTAESTKDAIARSWLAHNQAGILKGVGSDIVSTPVVSTPVVKAAISDKGLDTVTEVPEGVIVSPSVAEAAAADKGLDTVTDDTIFLPATNKASASKQVSLASPAMQGVINASTGIGGSAVDIGSEREKPKPNTDEKKKVDTDEKKKADTDEKKKPIPRGAKVPSRAQVDATGKNWVEEYDPSFDPFSLKDYGLSGR